MATAAELNAAKSTNASIYYFKQLYQNAGMAPPSDAKLAAMAANVKTHGAGYFATVANNLSRYQTPTSGTSSPSSTRQNSGTVVPGQVAKIRQRLGLPPDPASDRIWADRLNAGTHTVAQAEAAIQSKGGTHSDLLGQIARIRADMGLDPDPDSDKIWADRIILGQATLETVASRIGDKQAQNVLAENEELMQGDARAQVLGFLQRYGLEDLIGFVDDMIKGKASLDMIKIKLKEHPRWKERFAGNEMRIAAGMRELAPSEYVEWEEQIAGLFRAAELPSGFYDGPSDFAEFIGKGISPQLVADRVNRGVRQVVQADPAVRREFARLLGSSAAGDSALLSLALDPDRATSVVENAFLRGSLNVKKPGLAGRSDDIASQQQQRGLSIEQALTEQDAGLAKLTMLEPLLTETISERTDLSEQREGADVAFGLDQGESLKSLDRRRQERDAAFSGGGGAVFGRGVSGFGGSR